MQQGVIKKTKKRVGGFGSSVSGKLYLKSWWKRLELPQGWLYMDRLKIAMFVARGAGPYLLLVSSAQVFRTAMGVQAKQLEGHFTA